MTMSNFWNDYLVDSGFRQLAGVEARAAREAEQQAHAMSHPAAMESGGRQHVSDAAPKAGLSPALRERAERAVGRVRALNFTRAAPDEAVVTHLCEIAERLGRSDMAQLDQENARLRGELVAARIERDNWRADAQRYAGNVDYWRERAEGKPAAGNVTRIEPFPEPAPRSESWPPPSHKPRMLP